MLTDAQVYCMTSMIYLLRPPLTAKAIYRKTAEAKLFGETLLDTLQDTVQFIGYFTTFLAIVILFMDESKGL